MTVAVPLFSRRRTLQLGFAHLALAFGCGSDDDAGNGPDAPLCTALTEEPAPTSLDALLAVVGPAAFALFDPQAMAPLAEVRDAWLAAVAPEGTDAEILAAVTSSWPLLALVPNASPDCITPRVRSAVQADLSDLRTVDVEGWTLSPTELQVVTIATLYHEASLQQEAP